LAADASLAPHCPWVCVGVEGYSTPPATAPRGPRPPGGRPPTGLSCASQLQARAPGERARLRDYCAGAMFVQQLLSRGYGFHERAFGGVTFQKKVGAGGPGARRGGASPGCAGG